MEAACAEAAEGIEVLPEIMIPLVGTEEELRRLREHAEAVAQAVLARSATPVPYQIGTMIEIPRAALTAERIARHADFFSFGTNDLTQLTFGYSRDDAGVFLPEYVAEGVLEQDPFQVMDPDGVGALVEHRRRARPRRQAGAQGRHLRRARRRSRLDRLLPAARHELRVLLAVPGADRAPGGRAVRAAGRGGHAGLTAAT